MSKWKAQKEDKNYSILHDDPLNVNWVQATYELHRATEAARVADIPWWNPLGRWVDRMLTHTETIGFNGQVGETETKYHKAR